ncbi:ComF family protein [Pseudomaricurvus alkylphenolicus]|jgi:ComF family protein|uniref:ComF family protein n=1 Tax=Pseudomaricurvus alkylphenolicus TaxID=1306991 RepID=UPI0014200AAC|nr:ComF family protein [Pseudomaricurvus alkylphenolicus]NIB39252.1 ComF family protein [Pseudomaricurvus alkylphenolicus]
MDLPLKANRLFKGLLPAQNCRNCLGPAEDHCLCSSCRQELEASEQRLRRCYRCALPLPGTESESAQPLCAECLAAPPPFKRCICAHHYHAPISQWLRQFKYRGDLRDGQLLGEQLAHRIEQTAETLPQWLIPVPLHWRKLLQRGFNQSQWISRHLHQRLQIPVLDCLRRSHGRYSQKELNREQRLVALRSAFRLRQGKVALLAGADVALIDDVVTTTATARSASSVLLSGGCRSVQIWCLARTEKSG